MENGVHGFKDRGSLVRAALDHLRKEKENQRLLESAKSYAEVYAADVELRELTDQAITGWPKNTSVSKSIQYSAFAGVRITDQADFK